MHSCSQSAVLTAYIEKVEQFLSGDLKASISPREYILKHAGYERYANDAYERMTKYCE